MVQLFAGLAQTVGVALFIAELQRVQQRIGQGDELPFPLVEERIEPRLRRNRHVMAAMRADLKALREGAMKDHLAAFGTFDPQIIRRLAPIEQRVELGADERGDPIHTGLAARFWTPRAGVGGLKRRADNGAGRGISIPRPGYVAIPRGRRNLSAR